jgi:hypothetical protein
MHKRWCRAWLAAALGGASLLGCHHAGPRPSIPPDPLFTSKKPVEARAETAQPVVAYHEPVVPDLPPTALASAPREHVVLKPQIPALVPPPSPVPGQPAPPAAVPAVNTHSN